MMLALLRQMTKQARALWNNEVVQQDERLYQFLMKLQKRQLMTEKQTEASILKKRAEEDETIRLAAEEDGYKRGFEAGLEAARKAEPTAEEAALLAEKEQQRQAMITVS